MKHEDPSLITLSDSRHSRQKFHSHYEAKLSKLAYILPQIIKKP